MTTYSAVRTTGIYCRPGCSARPRAENVTTYELAAAAEAAGYRACLTCRPYRIAGPVDPGAPELVCRAVQMIIGGALDQQTEATLGRRLGVSTRHLRRLFTEHLGATPTQLALSRRTHFARRLLDDSDLAIAQVAFASGFGSIRHFNRAMRDVFRSSPRDLRARRRRNDRLIADGGLVLRLPFDPPFDWAAALHGLSRRAIPGIESVEGGVYRRTIVLDGAPGMLEVEGTDADHLLLRVHLPYWEGLIHVVERAARMLGIDQSVGAGEAVLATDPALAPLLDQHAGMRVPGSWGAFETAVGVVIERSIGTAEARVTLAAIVQAIGTQVPGLPDGLTHAFPSAETVAAAAAGLTATTPWPLPVGLRRTLVDLAAAVAAGTIQLDGASSHGDLVASLTAIDGIDAGAAEQIALRLGHRDAFPADDPLLRRAIAEIDPAADDIAARAEAWRPWRALAATHLLDEAREVGAGACGDVADRDVTAVAS